MVGDALAESTSAVFRSVYLKQIHSIGRGSGGSAGLSELRGLLVVKNYYSLDIV